MGFKRKFKKGDKVQVIKSNDSRYNQIGKIRSYHSSYGSKGFYSVNFEDGVRDYYSHELEKIEGSSNIKSNKLSISDLKPGMKVRIRPDLKKGPNSSVFVNESMVFYKGTIHTIKEVNLNSVIRFTDISYNWSIDCFSEIVEEPEEEVKVSEEIKFPLKEGQVVTLLDGKKYQVCKNNTKKIACNLCSLYIKNCGKDRCHITHINGRPSCPLVVPAGYYFKLCEAQKTEDNSSKSLTISDFKIGMRVRVKEDFDKIITDPDYSSNISSKMKSFKGKELIVEGMGIDFIIAKSYCWLPEWLEIVDKSINSSNSVEDSPIKEVGIITKVNFTLADFKSEELKHSKFTIL